MYKNKLNQKLRPYNFFKDSAIDYNIVLREYKDELDKWNFNDIKLKPVVKFLKENRIAEDIAINYCTTEVRVNYPFIYTTKMSNSWFDKGAYNFYLNGKHINTYTEDILKVCHFQGYVYICFKNDTPITSLLVVRTNLPAAIVDNDRLINIANKDKKLELPYDENFKFKRASIDAKKLVIKNPYIRLGKNEDIFTFLKRYMNNPIDWLMNNKIISYLILDNKGIADKTGITLDTFNISVGNVNKELYLFYNGEDPETYVKPTKPLFHSENCYLEDLYTDLFSNSVIYNYLMDHKELLIQNNEIDMQSQIEEYHNVDDGILMNGLLGYSYDLFMELYKVKHQTKRNFVWSDFTPVEQTSFSKFDFDKTDKNKYGLYELTFLNFFNNPFELYFNNVLYTSSFITEQSGIATTIFIDISNIIDAYDITKDDLENLICTVVLKNKDYKRVNYSNLNNDFNGTLPIGMDWYNIQNKKVYDNGVLLKDTDYAVNSIYPSGLVCLFPKRKQLHHLIQVIGNKSKYTKIYTKDIIVKYKNLSSTEINDKKSPDKYIYKSIMYTDYIDYRFNIYIGGHLLIENYDYKILASNVIEFLRPVYVFEEDRDLDTISIKIEYEGELEEWLTKIHTIKSYKYRLFNDNDFMEKYYSTKNDLALITTRDIINNYPLYRTDVYRFTMMMTKYFSSEILATAEEDAYGEEFYNRLQGEFPEFVRTIDGKHKIQTDFQCEYKEMIRRIMMPEFFNIHEIIMKHMDSVEILRFENKLLDRETTLNDIYYRYKIRGNYKGDLVVCPNIPTDYIIDKN